MDDTNPVLNILKPVCHLKKKKHTVSPVSFSLSLFIFAELMSVREAPTFSSSRPEFKSFIGPDYGCMTFRALALVKSCSCWAPIRRRISAMLETCFVTAADTWRCEQDSVLLWVEFYVWWSHKAPIWLQGVFETHSMTSRVFIFFLLHRSINMLIIS